MPSKDNIISATARRSEIFIMLVWEGKIVTKELAKEFGVSTRTIQKDIKKLKEPLKDIIEHKNGTYTLKKDIKSSTVTTFEENSKISMENLLYTSIINDKDFDKFDKENKENLIKGAVLLKPDCKKIEKEKIFRLIRKIMVRYPKTITYKNRKGEVKDIDIYLYKLLLLGNYWYLAAKEIHDNKIKLFRVDNILEIKNCSEPWEAEEERLKAMEKVIEIESPWFEEGNLKKVKLKIEGEAKQYITDNLPPNSELLEETEGFILINFGYYHIDEAINFIKKWLPDITPLNNPELTKKIKQILTEYLEKNFLD